MKVKFLLIATFILLVFYNINVYGSSPQKEAFFNSNGFKLHYLEQGEGEAVILLHGFTMDAQSWVDKGVVPALAEDFRVIAFDARAHGKSEKLRDKNAYGFECALDVIRLMDHLNIDKAHLVSSSFGARLATTILSHYPERFITSTMVGGLPKWNWTEKDQESVEKSADSFKNNPFPSTIEKGLDPTALAYLRLSFSELIVKSEEKFKLLETPFLLVTGSNEAVHRRGWDKEFKEMMPNVQTLVIDGAKHGEPLDKLEFHITLKKFLIEN